MPRPHPPTAPDLTLAFTKHADGSTIFRLTRADGTATWQRTRGLALADEMLVVYDGIVRRAPVDCRVVGRLLLGATF